MAKALDDAQLYQVVVAGWHHDRDRLRRPPRRVERSAADPRNEEIHGGLDQFLRQRFKPLRMPGGKAQIEREVSPLDQALLGQAGQQRSPDGEVAHLRLVGTSPDRSDSGRSRWRLGERIGHANRRDHRQYD